MPERVETPQAQCARSISSPTTPTARAATACWPDNTVYAIDNGLCFHVEPKLRTVIWDFAGQPVPEPALADLRRFVGARFRRRWPSFSIPTSAARCAPARALLRKGCFPGDGTGEGYPWPLV